jgi:hypothetical protein
MWARNLYSHAPRRWRITNPLARVLLSPYPCSPHHTCSSYGPYKIGSFRFPICSCNELETEKEEEHQLRSRQFSQQTCARKLSLHFLVAPLRSPTIRCSTWLLVQSNSRNNPSTLESVVSQSKPLLPSEFVANKSSHSYSHTQTHTRHQPLIPA